MSGKLKVPNYLISFLLLGFCLYIIRLFVQGNINLYIHPRYSMFSVVMSGIAIAILLYGLVIDFLNRSKAKSHSFLMPLDAVVIVVLALAFILPARVLSSETIDRRSLNTPNYDNSEHGEALPFNAACPATKPASIEMWVHELSRYPLHCFKGQNIEITGFVFESDENKLPDSMFYLGRVVMSCCAVDVRPYALPILKGDVKNHPKDTWLKVSGKLEIAKVNDKFQLVIKPTEVEQIRDPSQPYEYLNTPSTELLEPIPTIDQ